MTEIRVKTLGEVYDEIKKEGGGIDGAKLADELEAAGLSTPEDQGLLEFLRAEARGDLY